MAFKFYQTRPNTIKHIKTRSISTKEGVQTVKCLVTKQCLMLFGRQTFIVCLGPYVSRSLMTEMIISEWSCSIETSFMVAIALGS